MEKIEELPATRKFELPIVIAITALLIIILLLLLRSCATYAYMGDSADDIPCAPAEVWEEISTSTQLVSHFTNLLEIHEINLGDDLSRFFDFDNCVFVDVEILEFDENTAGEQIAILLLHVNEGIPFGGDSRRIQIRVPINVIGPEHECDEDGEDYYCVVDPDTGYRVKVDPETGDRINNGSGGNGSGTGGGNTGSGTGGGNTGGGGNNGGGTGGGTNPGGGNNGGGTGGGTNPGGGNNGGGTGGGTNPGGGDNGGGGGTGPGDGNGSNCPVRPVLIRAGIPAVIEQRPEPGFFEVIDGSSGRVFSSWNDWARYVGNSEAGSFEVRFTSGLTGEVRTGIPYGIRPTFPFEVSPEIPAAYEYRNICD